MIPLPFNIPWRMVAYAAAAVALFIAGWTVNGWRWDAKWNEREAEYAAAVTKATEEAREREQVMADAFAMIDAERTAERTKANEESRRLRAAVDAGTVSLRIAARCPAGLSETAAGPGVGDGTGAELSADARSDYFTLREGLTRQAEKLSACQAILKAERAGE